VLEKFKNLKFWNKPEEIPLPIPVEKITPVYIQPKYVQQTYYIGYSGNINTTIFPERKNDIKTESFFIDIESEIKWYEKKLSWDKEIQLLSFKTLIKSFHDGDILTVQIGPQITIIENLRLVADPFPYQFPIIPGKYDNLVIKPTEFLRISYKNTKDFSKVFDFTLEYLF